MNENAKNIQIVINTLATLDMPSTYDNANKLLGMYQLLAKVRDALDRPEEAEDDGGKAEAE